MLVRQRVESVAMTEQEQHHRVHLALEFLGMRAQATAIGLVQLCTELRRAGVIDEAAVNRVKDSIAEEIAEHAPRTVAKHQYLKDIRGRLDRIFAGDEPIGAVPGGPAVDQPPVA